MSSLALSCALSFLLGARHASEPDHLAAVTTLLADAPNARRAAWLGAFWGVGHAASLFILGGVLVLLRQQLPAAAGDALELCVAVMLLGLGIHSLARAIALGQSGRPTHHTHGELTHAHPMHEPHLHLTSLTLARRPLLIGLMHGLAGSGALAALTMASMPTLGAALGSMALFGAGSVFGMSALSGLIGVPLGRLARARYRYVRVGLIAVAGLTSTCVGVLWGWPLLLRFTGMH